MCEVYYNKVRIIVLQASVIISIIGSYKWENILINWHKDPYQIVRKKNVFLFFSRQFWGFLFVCFLIELMLSSSFNVNVISSIKYERRAENWNPSCRILSLSAFIRKFKKKKSWAKCFLQSWDSGTVKILFFEMHYKSPLLQRTIVLCLVIPVDHSPF